MEGDQRMDNAGIKVDEVKAPHSLAEMVKSGNTTLEYYKEDNLYYSFEAGMLDNKYKYEFPIDTSNKEDIGETRLENTYKTITLMRYIRKAIANGTLRWDKII